MPAVGSLRVELELDDGSFTTRVIRAGTTLQQLDRQVSGTIVGIRRLDNGFAEAMSTITNFTLTLGLARAALQNVYAVFGQWAVSIAQTGGEIERLNALLRGMSTAITDVERAAEGGRATQYILELTRNAPFGVRDLTDSFVRLRSSGLDPTAGSLQGLVDAVAAFGGNAQNLERASIAIQQMAGKGVISMEELRQQLGEAVPQVVPLMARALNMSVDQLVKAVSDGKVRAEPALRALSAEFERTFGGRAQAMMETFRGQVQQVQNNWTRLQMAASGQDERGQVIDGGFLDRLTEAMQRLNTAMASAEGRSFAMEVGQFLTGMTDALEKGITFVVTYREEIGNLIKVVGGLAAFMAARAIIMSFGSALTAMGLSWAVAASPMAAFMAQMTRLGSVVGLVADALMVWGRNFAASMAALGTIASAAVMPLIALLGRLAGGLVNAGVAFLNFAIAARGVIGLAGVFTIAGVGIAAFAAAVAGAVILIRRIGTASQETATMAAPQFSIIGNFVDWLSEKYRRLTTDANGAYERIRMGAFDGNSADEVAQQTAALERELEKARNLMRAWDASPDPNEPGLRGRERERRRSALWAMRQSFSGQGAPGVPDISSDLATDKTQYRERVGQFAIAAEQRIAEQRETLQAASYRRMEALANAAADAQVRILQGQLQRTRAEYQVNAIDIAREMDAAKRAFDAREITRDQYDERVRAAQQRNLENQRSVSQQEIQIFEEGLNAAQARLREIAAGNDQQAIENTTKTIERLQQLLQDARRRLGEVGQDIGEAVNGALNQQAKDREAQTTLNNMLARIASLREQTQGFGGELARINTLLAQGRWGDVGSDMTNRLKEAATQVDELNAALRRTRDGEQAANSLGDLLRRLSADVRGYTAELADPSLPEAQRAFIRQQAEIADMLQRVAAGFGENSTQMALARAQAAAAAQMGPIVQAMRMAGELNREVEGLKIRASERGQSRAAAQEARLRRLYQPSIDALFRADPEDASGAAYRMQQQLQQAINLNRQVENNATAGSGSKAINDAAQLRARLEELRGQVADGTGEWERWSAILANSTRHSEAQKQEILGLARAIDEQTKRLERAREAQRALDEITRGTREAAGRQNEYFNQLANPSVAEGNRSYVNFRAQMQERMRLIREEGDAARIAAAERAIPEALAARAGELAGQEAVRQREATRQIRESLAESLADRRNYASQLVELERQQGENLIAASNLSAERRKQAEDQLAAYIQARRDQVVRETEGATSKMFRSWGNAVDAMDQATAGGFERMTDAIATFVATGKADFKSLAQALIADLIKIQIRAAASGIFRLLGNAVGGMFGAAGGDVSSVAPMGGAASGDSTNFIAGTYQGIGQHQGGITGSEATFLRTLPSAVWASAPRFHKGGYLGSDEVPAILQKGEGVFTAGQMAAIGRMNHSYTLVENVMTKMAESLAMPDSARPAMPGQIGGNAAAPAMPPVTVNVNNETGQPVGAMAGMPRFDGEQMIIDVVIKNMNRPGPLRDSMKSMA